MSSRGSIVASWAAPDGRLARTMLGVYQMAESSLLFLVTLAPLGAFHALVGWQPTHLSLWLGVAALLPAGPGLYALLAVSADFLDERGYPGRGVRRFAAAYLDGVRSLAAWWGLAAVLLLGLAYNAVLYGASDAGLVAIVVGAWVVAAVTTLLCLAARLGDGARLLTLLRAVGVAAVRRPQVAIAWAVLLVGVAASALIPLIGSSLMLVLPGLAATSLLIVASAFGLMPLLERELFPDLN